MGVIYLTPDFMNSNGSGLISQVLGWFTHPQFSEGGVLEWTMGLGLLFIIAFLWYTVVNKIGPEIGA